MRFPFAPCDTWAVGIAISGMIEIRPWPRWPDMPHEIPWEAAISLDHLNVTRDYDSFGCLFGVMNYAGFRPIAAERGLPADASTESTQAFQEQHRVDPGAAGLWPTWIGWEEIQEIDWEEHAEHADARLHEYVQNDEGEWTYRGKAGFSAQALHAQGLPVPPFGTPPTIWPDGSTWTLGDVQFRAVRLTRRDAIPAGSAWQPVWEAMELLARLHHKQCRLIVWFDR
jgi:hypothetical protein